MPWQIMRESALPSREIPASARIEQLAPRAVSMDAAATSPGLQRPSTPGELARSSLVPRRGVVLRWEISVRLPLLFRTVCNLVTLG